jgi:hypothetical protein
MRIREKGTGSPTQTRGYSGKMPIAKANCAGRAESPNHQIPHANLKISQDVYKIVYGVGLVWHSKCYKGSP